MNNDLLPDFQKYLARRKLAPDSQIPFFAYWVGKFLRFSNALLFLFREVLTIDLHDLNKTVKAKELREVCMPEALDRK